jgi:hypothetical protein
MPYIDDDKLIYNIRELPESFSITSGDLLVVEDTEGTKTIDFDNIIIGLDNTTFGTTITQNATDIVALSATNNNLTTAIATNTANILSLSANTVVVTNETELIAAVAAAEPHITFAAVITLTSKIVVPVGTTLKMQNGTGIDFQNALDMMEFNGGIDVPGDHQVFFNTLPYPMTGINIDGPGSLVGSFHGTRHAGWWGPAALGGDQTDQNALQCAVDSGLISRGHPGFPDVLYGATAFEVYAPLATYSMTDTLWFTNRRLRFRGDLYTQLRFNIPAGSQDACIDMSDTIAWNNVWDTQLVGFRMSDDSTRTDLIGIKGSLLEERSKISDIHIASYGSHGIWMANGGGNTGLIENCNITGPKSDKPVGIRITGLNGSITVRNCAVVNPNTYIAFWQDRNGQGPVTFINCHEESADIGYLIGPDPAVQPASVVVTTDRQSKTSIIDCTSNTKHSGERAVWITSGTATVRVCNLKCENSDINSIILDDYWLNNGGASDEFIPLSSSPTGLPSHAAISEFRRWPVIASRSASSYRRPSDPTFGVAASYGGWRVHHILDLYGNW